MVKSHTNPTRILLSHPLRLYWLLSKNKLWKCFSSNAICFRHVKLSEIAIIIRVSLQFPVPDYLSSWKTFMEILVSICLFVLYANTIKPFDVCMTCAQDLKTAATLADSNVFRSVERLLICYNITGNIQNARRTTQSYSAGPQHSKSVLIPLWMDKSV